MLTQSFSMIGHYGDQRTIVKAAQPQPVEKLADRRIDVGNLAIVGSRGVASLERLRRIIGIVSVVEMDPDEEWAVMVCCQPVERVPDDFAATTLNRLIAVFSRTSTMEAGIIKVESAFKAGGRARFGI